MTDNKLTISVTVDGEVRTVTVTAFGGTLNAGGYYHVTLTINDVQIVPSAGVTDNGYTSGMIRRIPFRIILQVWFKMTDNK